MRSSIRVPSRWLSSWPRQPLPPRHQDAISSFLLRGYDQTLLIARRLGTRLALPVLSHALARTRATESQARLERGLRFANTLGAFHAQGDDLAGRRVLLLDDVVTTGATLSAAGLAVLDAGAYSVSLVAVAGPPE